MIPFTRNLFSVTITSAGVVHLFSRRLSEWHLAGVMLTAGIILATSDTMELPAYDVVQQMAGQGTWATAMILIGVARLVALIDNGHRPRLSSHFRWALASASSFAWALMLAGLLAFDTPLMVSAFLGAAVIVDLVTAFRAAQDARLADDSGAKNGSG